MKRHPAVQAWLRAYPGSVEPREITFLKNTKRSVVCKLDGIRPGSSALVAKRCEVEDGKRQSLVYEALSHLPIEFLRCYGFVKEEDDQQYGWLFVEDAAAPDLRSEKACELKGAMARWLGVLHSSASKLGLSGQLPDRGPSWFLGIVRSARQWIPEGLKRKDLPATSYLTLITLLECLEALEKQWHRIEEHCHSLPWTLVHCDFQPKNILVRRKHLKLALLVIDWEEAGWGPPAADLGGIDCHIYWRAVRKIWPHTDLQAVQKQAHCGAIFKTLAAVDWEREQLLGWSAERAIRRLQIYTTDLGALAVACRLKA